MCPAAWPSYVPSVSFRAAGERATGCACKSAKSGEDVEKFTAGHPDVIEFLEKFQEQFEECCKRGMVKTDDVASKTTMLVTNMLMLRFDYQFGRQYPGGDMDVYDGCFSSVMDECLAIAGLYPNDRPKSYDFDDEDEYERRLMEFDSEHKRKLYAFMEETEGLKIMQICD